jgi:lysophospholipase L1-like esterase
VIGDSINNGPDVYANSGSNGDVGYVPFMGDAYFHHLSIESFQRIRYGGYYAHDGYTLGQTRTNKLPTVLALSPRPGACIVMAGANDCSTGVAFATMVSDLKSIVAQLLAASIVPILVAVPPDEYSASVTGADAAVRKWNTWIRRYAALNGLPLIDAYSPVTGVNGQWLSGYALSDLVNPSPIGHAAIARQALSDGLADIFAPSGSVLTSKASTDLTNIFGSGSLNYGVFTTNTAGVGTGLTQSGTGTPSIVTPSASDQLAGNWPQLARTAGQTGTTQLGRTISFGSGWSVGDTLAFSARIQTSGIQAGNNYLYTDLAQSIPGGYTTPVGSQTTMFVGVFNWQTDITDGLMYVEFQVLPGTGGLGLGLGIGNPGGTIVGNPLARWGEVTLVNLTTNGLLV